MRATLWLLLLAGCDVAAIEPGGSCLAIDMVDMAAIAAPIVAGPRCDTACDDGVSEHVDRRTCPPEMKHIGRFCIDKWEAHLVAYKPDGSASRHPHYLRPNDESVRYEARSAAGAYPQGYISRVEARAACEGSGKRLCSWVEWRAGCRFTLAKNCNKKKEHLFSRLYGDDPTTWRQSQFNDPRLLQEPGFLSKAGAHPECSSRYGVYDMVGNLHEWVSDRVTTRFMEELAEDGQAREKQPWGPGNGMFLGGFFSTRSEHGYGCLFTTVAHDPTYHDYSTGFRCCADAR